MIDHEVDLGVAGGLNDPAGVRNVGREGFLAQYMFPGVDCRECHFCLPLRWNGDIDEVKLRFGNEVLI